MLAPPPPPLLASIEVENDATAIAGDILQQLSSAEHWEHFFS